MTILSYLIGLSYYSCLPKKEQKGVGCSMISVRSTEFWHNSDPCVTKLITNTTSTTRGPSKKYTRSIDGNLNLQENNHYDVDIYNELCHRGIKLYLMIQNSHSFIVIHCHSKSHNSSKRVKSSNQIMRYLKIHCSFIRQFLPSTTCW